MVVLDEAHHLSDAFLFDLAGFLNFAWVRLFWRRRQSTVSHRSA
jgi:hypothetical protein